MNVLRAFGYVFAWFICALLGIAIEWEIRWLLIFHHWLTVPIVGGLYFGVLAIVLNWWISLPIYAVVSIAVSLLPAETLKRSFLLVALVVVVTMGVVASVSFFRLP